MYRPSTAHAAKRPLLLAAAVVAAFTMSVVTPVAAAKSASSADARRLPPETRQSIDAAIDKTIAEGKAPGVIFGLWIPGQGSYVTARGLADPATNTPMRTDMVMPIGSITKTFTATMVLQLVDDKKLKLDDTLDRWYPEIPEASAITVRMLLNMSSGIADYANPNISTFCAMPTKQWSPEELIALGVGAPRAFDPPGSAYSYSTTNTVLLGRIIEKVTGQSYEHNLQTRMLEPLGLHHSGL